MKNVIQALPRPAFQRDFRVNAWFHQLWMVFNVHVRARCALRAD